LLVQLLGRLEREVTMLRVIYLALLGGVVLLSIGLNSQQSQPTRIGMLIGIKPDRITAYEALHAASNQGVRDLLDKYHMHNFSIYIQKMDDSHYYLFGYYEYTGDNYKADMETMAKEPRNIQWLSKTDAMQIPQPGQKSWTKMQEVFHNP
jgi:L-rhamnose mutarotase